jgi:hypothetical protein
MPKVSPGYTSKLTFSTACATPPSVLKYVFKFLTSIIGFLSKIGIYFLMIKFGASFGFAVMGRISLLIGRVQELKNYSSSEFYYATPIILLIIIAILFVWSIKGQKEIENV